MFLQDIAVKLNDFGVLVQLLVVDFFKFCFRNANVDMITIILYPMLGKALHLVASQLK